VARVSGETKPGSPVSTVRAEEWLIVRRCWLLGWGCSGRADGEESE